MPRLDINSQKSNAGEKILSLFLGVPSCRVLSIIKLKVREKKNSTCPKVLLTNQSTKVAKLLEIYTQVLQFLQWMLMPVRERRVKEANENLARQAKLQKALGTEYLINIILRKDLSYRLS